jgi:hypothetical protein
MRLALAASGLAIVLALAAGPASAQISPGKLSRAHAALEGSGKCLQCHEAGRGPAPAKCLACHSALRERMAAAKGLHARPDYQDCKTCHVEHQGLESDVVWWGKQGRQAFEHRTTGYVLEGRHAGLTCEVCHQGRLGSRRQALEGRGVNLSRTYLGLGTACAACHADEHRGQFAGRDCASCHTQTAWKPALGFDHATTAWPLTGRHSAVSCEKCHRSRAPDPDRPGANYVRYRGGESGRECRSCHEDAHRGRLGSACAECHTTASWARIERSRFDHDRTAYPLRGRHVGLACDRCHTPGRPRPIRYGRCKDCHADAHLGQLAGRADGGACEACHDVTGFIPARFGIDEHRATAYPLDGSHLAVPCNACHLPATAAELRRMPGSRVQAAASGRSARFRFASPRCASCHRDPHRGELDAWIRKGGCEGCHRTEAWKPAAFDHKETRFALAAAHARAACTSCHRREGTKPDSQLRFSGAPVTCQGCHVNAHDGQLTPPGRDADCGRCHDASTLKASRFDHSRDSALLLDGAHARLACSACHRAETKGGVVVVRYKPLPRTCRGCHSDNRTLPQGTPR